MMAKVIKALSLECLGPQTVLDTPRNSEIFREIMKLDEEYHKNLTRMEKIQVLARTYDLCLIMDVM